jgi:FHA domain
MSTALDFAPDAVPAPETGTSVMGVHCKNAHFNDPSMAYCTVCGISMMQATRVPVAGNRPPLGVLVLDDGTMLPLERDHVVGRVPKIDGTVTTGEAAALSLDDPLVSKVHARVVLDGWKVTVVDAGSTNGTFVWTDDEQGWRRLRDGEAAELRPGTTVAFGHRQLSYHSYRHR